MQNLLMKVLNRFHDPPDNIPEKKHRIFVFANYIFLIAGSFHFFLIFIFAFSDLNILSIYNIVSSIFWIFAIYLNLHGFLKLAISLANIEVVTHAYLCCIIIGWESGFFYYILLIPLIVFLSVIPIKYKLTWGLLNCLAYSLLFHYTSINQPIEIISFIHLKKFHHFNIICTFFCLSFLAYRYRGIVFGIEQKLEIANRTTQNTLTRLNEELSDAANYVKNILPQPIKKGSVISDYVFIPSESLGGDAFGYNWIDKNHFAIFLLDVSGHGVSAALLSATIMNVLRSNSLPDVDFREPDQVLSALNRSFPSEDNNDMFFTIWYGVYDRKEQSLTFASGGHPPALLFNKSNGNNHLIKLGTKNYVVGGFEGTNFKQDTYFLNGSSSLYVFSDGVYEFMQSDGIRWKYDEFENYLSTVHSKNGTDLKNVVNPIIGLNNSNVFEDDFTILKVSFS